MAVLVVVVVVAVDVGAVGDTLEVVAHLVRDDDDDCATDEEQKAGSM